MRTQRIISSLLLFLLLFASIAESETTLLKLPVYDSPGQLWLDADGNLKGFRLEVLEELNNVLKNDNVKLEYEISEGGNLPIKRAIHEIINGKYDAYFGLIYSKEREDMGLRYSQQELYSIPTVVWMKKDKQFDYKGLESFKGKTIGVVSGYPYLQDLKNPDFRIDEAPHDESNVKKLMMGRVDAIIDHIPRTGIVIVNLGFANQITYADRPFEVSKFQIAYNSNVPESVIKKIDLALEKLHKSGVIQKILDKNIYDPLKRASK